MIPFKMMYNMSMLRHRFSNERWGRPEPPSSFRATFHLTISMRTQRATGTIQSFKSLIINVVGVFDLHARDASECQKSLSEK